MMNKKCMKKIAVPVIILAILIIAMSVVKDSIHTRSRKSVKGELHLIETIASARNHLSIQLNKARQVIGRMDCEMSKGLTNIHGGWCRTASTEEGGQHMTDMSLIPHLSFLLKEKTVASFGDGPGAYKREIMKLGQVKLYDAFDGAPYTDENSSGNVNFLDLTIPQYGIPFYDWIISLEVAEHIPKEFESIYLDNLFRHAKEGIILSWAVPGQVGLQHVNNQPLTYVINVMKENGFARDESLSNKLQASSSLKWIRSNINVYIRTNYSGFDSEKRLVQWFI